MAKESRGFILGMASILVAPATFLGALGLAGLEAANSAATVAVAVLTAGGGIATARALKDLFIGKAQAASGKTP